MGQLTVKGISEIDEEIKPKYKVGDELTYINDYCVNWGLRTITDMVQDKWGWNYYISPTETPWCPVREKNLYVPGTEPTFELELNNGMTVKLVETDWNGNRYYDIGGRKAVLTDGSLYSTVSDWEEPCCRLDEQFQPNTEKAKLSIEQNEMKCDNPTPPEAETVEKTTSNDYFSTRGTDKSSAPSRGISPKR